MRSRASRAPQETPHPGQGTAWPRLPATPTRGSSGPPPTSPDQVPKDLLGLAQPHRAPEGRRQHPRVPAHRQPPWSVTARPRDGGPRSRSGLSGPSVPARATHQEPRRASKRLCLRLRRSVDKEKVRDFLPLTCDSWSGRLDLNQRPLGPETMHLVECNPSRSGRQVSIRPVTCGYASTRGFRGVLSHPTRIRLFRSSPGHLPVKLPVRRRGSGI